MVDKIRKLEAHVKQLRNVIAKSDGVVKKKRKKLSKNKRVFDFNKYVLIYYLLYRFRDLFILFIKRIYDCNLVGTTY